jgi:putative ATP-binding cassette transporter
MESITEDSEITTVLRKLGIEDVVERAGGLGANKDWDDVFSIGEQHLLSIARMCLAHPAFVFLDRPASSLPSVQIASILDMFTDQKIGVVVLAKNGESQLGYDVHLELKAEGQWAIHHKLEAAPQSAPVAT